MEFVKFEYQPIILEAPNRSSWKISAIGKYKENSTVHQIGTIGLSEATIENVLKAINNTMSAVIELTNSTKKAIK